MLPHLKRGTKIGSKKGSRMIKGMEKLLRWDFKYFTKLIFKIYLQVLI